MLAALVALARQRSPGRPPLVVVFDEFPFQLRHSPELPSVLQHFVDFWAERRDAPDLRIVLCGSSLVVMSELLSGQQPLRGRASLVLRLEPFDFREAREYWAIEDLDLAFRLDALLGGVAGHRALLLGGRPGRPPVSTADLGAWLSEGVLNPAHALSGEADYLLREDPRVVERSR